jgi:hypothetical protein
MLEKLKSRLTLQGLTNVELMLAGLGEGKLPRMNSTLSSWLLSLVRSLTSAQPSVNSTSPYGKAASCR